MGWMPGVRVAPIPSSNYSRDGKRKIGVSAHHMDSTFASADGWFHNPIAQASSHFGVDYAGNITQWVDVDDVAYAQCMGNWQGWVTVENESDPDQPNAGPTPEQIVAMGRIIRFVGTPAVPATSMYSGGVGYHRQFGGPCSEAWGQTACPGDGFIAAIPDICAAASGAPAPSPKKQKETDMVIYHNVDVADPATDKATGEWVAVFGDKGPTAITAERMFGAVAGGVPKVEGQHTGDIIALGTLLAQARKDAAFWDTKAT